MNLGKFERRRFMARGAAAVLPLIGSRDISSVPRKAQGVSMSDRSADEPAYEENKRLRVDNYINAVAWNADGSRLAALSNFGGTVTIWDAQSWTIVKEFHRYGGAYSQNSLAFLPDGTLLTAAPIGNSPDPKYATLAIFSLIQWDSETGQPIRYIPDQGSLPKDLSDQIGPANTFVISADGSKVAGISKGHALLFETQGWSVVRRFATPPTSQHPDYADAVAISPNGQRIAVGTGFGHVHIFDVDGRKRPLSFVAFPGGFGKTCGAIAFDSNGQFLATGRGLVSVGEADDGWTRIWRVDDGTLVARLTGGEGSVRTLTWNRSGDELAVGDDRMLRLWRTSDPPQQPRLLKKARDRSFSAAFSPSGVLAASDGSEVVIYA